MAINVQGWFFSAIFLW